MSWKHYNVPVYWTLPDDGAPIRCGECGVNDKCENVILVQTPDDKRQVLHKECCDEDWLKSSTFLGEFKD